MAEDKKPRKIVDWEAVEREYRAGIRSLRDIGKEFGCSHTAIQKRAEAEGWVRDISARISAEAEAKVARAQVSTEVAMETKIAERQIVEVNAQMLADKVLNQREDIRRARATVQKLWAQVDAELDSPAEFSKLGVMLAKPDDFGNDKLNDMYFAAISLPQQVKNVKLLADALKVLIELERKVLKLDTMPDPDPEGEAKKAGAAMGFALASGVSDAMAALAAKVEAAEQE